MNLKAMSGRLLTLPLSNLNFVETSDRTSNTLYITEDLAYGKSNTDISLVSLDAYQVRDQFGDIDAYENVNGAHFWGTDHDDVFV